MSTTPPPAEPWVAKVRARVKPGDLLQVTGPFGQFSGRAARIDEQGLSGLQQDPAFESTLPLPREPLAWAEVNRIDRWGGRSRRFARNGGLVTGLAFALLASGAWSNWGTTSSEDYARGFAASFVMGGLVGAGVGAVLGAVSPGWNLLHRRSKPVAASPVPAS